MFQWHLIKLCMSVGSDSPTDLSGLSLIHQFKQAGRMSLKFQSLTDFSGGEGYSQIDFSAVSPLALGTHTTNLIMTRTVY